MSVITGEVITNQFTTRDATTGAATNADSTPTGTLVIQGVDQVTTVTITNISTGLYRYSVTLPTLTANYHVQIRIAATVNGVSDSAIVFSDSATFNALNITPVTATANPQFFAETNLPSMAVASAPLVTWAIVDSDDVAVNLSGKTVRLTASRTNESSAAAVFYHETGGSGITISGTDSNNVNVQFTITDTATPGQFYYWIWNITDNIALVNGTIPIVPAKKTTT
jgi:hypothetical protein